MTFTHNHYIHGPVVITLTDNAHINFNVYGVDHTVKIINSTEYIYKINKRSISAINGASGLYHEMKKWHDDDFCTAWINIITGAVIKF